MVNTRRNRWALGNAFSNLSFASNNLGSAGGFQNSFHAARHAFRHFCQEF